MIALAKTTGKRDPQTTYHALKEGTQDITACGIRTDTPKENNTMSEHGWTRVAAQRHWIECQRCWKVIGKEPDPALVVKALPNPDDGTNTIEVLQAQIEQHQIDPSTLYVFFDGDEVIVRGPGEDDPDLYRGYERRTIEEMFKVFLGIKPFEN